MKPYIPYGSLLITLFLIPNIDDLGLLPFLLIRLARNLLILFILNRVQKICWRRDRLPTPVFFGFAFGSAGKESTCNAEDLSSIPGLERSPGGGNSYPLQYSGLENSMGCYRNMIERLSPSLSTASNNELLAFFLPSFCFLFY